MKDVGGPWLVRDSLPRARPDRSVGNLYRSAAGDGKGKGGAAIGGIPLDNAEAAVVAAVRMAYRVAEVQIDRSARLARRLREAGDRATGDGSDRRAVDATERLVLKAFLAALGWLETAAAQGGSPLKRLAVAQYRLLGDLLGLTHRPRKTGRATGPRETPPAPAETAPARTSLRVRHRGPDRRAVRVAAWEYAGDAQPPATIPVTFYNVESPSEAPLDAEVVIDGPRSVTLALATPGSVAGGRWRAAVVDPEGIQVGQIEIVL